MTSDVRVRPRRGDTDIELAGRLATIDRPGLSRSAITPQHAVVRTICRPVAPTHSTSYGSWNAGCDPFRRSGGVRIRAASAPTRSDDVPNSAASFRTVAPSARRRASHWRSASVASTAGGACDRRSPTSPTCAPRSARTSASTSAPTPPRPSNAHAGSPPTNLGRAAAKHERPRAAPTARSAQPLDIIEPVVRQRHVRDRCVDTSTPPPHADGVTVAIHVFELPSRASHGRISRRRAGAASANVEGPRVLRPE